VSWQYDALGRFWLLQIGLWIATVERWPGSFDNAAHLEAKQLSVVIRGPHVFASRDEAQEWCIMTIAEQPN